MLRSIFRSLVLVGLLLAATADLWLRRPGWGTEGAVWIHGWCRRIACLMGIQLSVTGKLPESGAVVSNHLSYLGILLYSAIRPFVMVSKSEVKGWPLLGQLTAQAGTVYVDREGGPPTYAAVNRSMAEAYRSGLPVLFFPEGTTTDGSAILPFRRGLFHSVLDNSVELRTATLRYYLAGGNGTASAADDVCWWGEASFGPHLFGCLGLHGVTVRIHFDNTVVEGSDRFALSEKAQANIEKKFSELGHEIGDPDSSSVEEQRCIVRAV